MGRAQDGRTGGARDERTGGARDGRTEGAQDDRMGALRMAGWGRSGWQQSSRLRGQIRSRLRGQRGGRSRERRRQWPRTRLGRRRAPRMGRRICGRRRRRHGLPLGVHPEMTTGSEDKARAQEGGNDAGGGRVHRRRLGKAVAEDTARVQEGTEGGDAARGRRVGGDGADGGGGRGWCIGRDEEIGKIGGRPGRRWWRTGENIQRDRKGLGLSLRSGNVCEMRHDGVGLTHRLHGLGLSLRSARRHRGGPPGRSPQRPGRRSR